MPRLNWNRATDDDVARFVREAREFAAAHPQGAVRMFVFSLCKGLERCRRNMAPIIRIDGETVSAEAASAEFIRLIKRSQA